MRIYRIGIVGAGFMGRTHAWCWRSLPFFYSPLDFRCELHGVCTSKPETARKAMEELGFARTYASVEEMAGDPDIDIVDIASPNNAHLEALLAAHRAGKPVYCDKPLTGNLAQAEEYVRQTLLAPLGEGGGAGAPGGQMVFHNRFFPATMRARRMVAEGALGRIIGFRAAYLHSGNVPEGKPLAWKDMKQFGAGVLYDLGSHVLDLVLWICDDEPAEILARRRTLHPRRPSREDPTRIVEQDTDDQTVMLLTLKSGAVGTIEASKIATGAQDELKFEIEGTQGALRFSLMEPNYLDYFDMSRKETPLGGTAGFTRINCVQRFDPPAVFPAPKASIGWLRGHLHCLYSFISALHEGRPFDPSLMRGVQIERWLHAVERAATADMINHRRESQ